MRRSGGRAAWFSLPRELVERPAVAAAERPGGRPAGALAPPAAADVRRSQALLEERAHRRIVLESEPPEQLLVRRLALAVDQLVEHDDREASGRDRMGRAVLLAANRRLDLAELDGPAPIPAASRVPPGSAGAPRRRARRGRRGRSGPPGRAARASAPGAGCPGSPPPARARRPRPARSATGRARDTRRGDRGGRPPRKRASSGLEDRALDATSPRPASPSHPPLAAASSPRSRPARSGRARARACPGRRCESAPRRAAGRAAGGRRAAGRPARCRCDAAPPTKTTSARSAKVRCSAARRGCAHRSGAARSRSGSPRAPSRSSVASYRAVTSPLLGRIEPLAPALAVGGVGGHLGVEEPAHRRLVLDAEEVEQAAVGALPVAPDELVEADHVEALAVAGRPGRAPPPRRAAADRPRSRSPRRRRSDGASFSRSSTFEAPESRPSRTAWTNRASGKIRPARARRRS